MDIYAKEINGYFIFHEKPMKRKLSNLTCCCYITFVSIRQYNIPCSCILGNNNYGHDFDLHFHFHFHSHFRWELREKRGGKKRGKWYGRKILKCFNNHAQELLQRFIVSPMLLSRKYRPGNALENPYGLRLSDRCASVETTLLTRCVKRMDFARICPRLHCTILVIFLEQIYVRRFVKTSRKFME